MPGSDPTSWSGAVARADECFQRAQDVLEEAPESKQGVSLLWNALGNSWVNYARLLGGK